ncbi:MAG: 30S ribosomal protein S17 [Desulfurococcales archaeon]|jgi:small subunit ribosomal protein S17|nr:30S ribosomal protein S17 [Desulfurococcales archaeon]MCC6062018.1 30S ribosomal protein S17 [Desulfurococcales archaeon]MCI4457582.1 30S ribosomal protein S17 [Desulfurococcaceae archaeon]NAZ14402.1 30S ribosomal protein S17 [Desulfurococcales archaeon]
MSLTEKRSRVRDIGIVYEGLQKPEKICNDPNCPWHGNISVRGQIIEGVVVKNRMNRTVTVMREYLKYVPKYMRYERRRGKYKAHLPPCIDVKPGDVVLIGETRPLAKSVSFVVLGVVKRGGASG